MNSQQSEINLIKYKKNGKKYRKIFKQLYLMEHLDFVKKEKKQFIKTLMKLIQNLNFEHFKIWIIGLLKLGKMSEHPVPTFP